MLERPDRLEISFWGFRALAFGRFAIVLLVIVLIAFMIVLY